MAENSTPKGSAGRIALNNLPAKVVLPIFFGALAIVSLAYFLIANAETKVPPSAFVKYIEAYTSGYVSKTSAIKIRLTRAVADTSMLGKKIDQELFDFDPSVEGEAYWIDAKTIEFRPDEYMKTDQNYEARFFLSKIIKDVPDSLRTFYFDFRTYKQNFEVEIVRVVVDEADRKTKQKIIGAIRFADAIDTNDVKKIITVSQQTEKGDNKNLKIKYNFNSAGLEHRFIIENVKRCDTTSYVNVQWNGSRVGIAKKGSKKIEIPAIGKFKLLGYRIVSNNGVYVSLDFSDPLLKEQNLNGLVSFATDEEFELNFIINGNELRVLPSKVLRGEYTLNIYPGLKNYESKPLKQKQTIKLSFDQSKPAVEFIGKGTIVPGGDNLLVPFKAVGLNAVDLMVFRIYEDNVPQFFQVNTFSGSDELKRVASPVAVKRINLLNSGSVDLNKWNKYSLDLSEIIRAEPGAIYRLRLSFRKEYSLYQCGADSSGQTTSLASTYESEWDEDYSVEESSFWDYAEQYYSDYDDYHWDERNNPCHSSYYTGDRWASRNVLASDVGLIAKRGEDGNLLVAATDITSAEPAANVEIEILNFQNRSLAKTVTDAEGFAWFNNIKNKPFLVSAKKGKERGWLRLKEESSIPVGAFDVGGASVKKGLKGFLYGERGVWRPGDSLYLTFILEDKNGLLPPAHPVVFELINPRGVVAERIARRQSLNGFYSFRTRTNENAPTGSWKAVVKVGASKFVERVKIETVKPNRLKIHFDVGKDKITAEDEELKVKFGAKWLHGASAGNLKAMAKLTLSPMKTTFKGFGDFEFDDVTRNLFRKEINLYDGFLNSQGETQFTQKFSSLSSPGAVSAYFSAKVFEPGGAFSIDGFKVPYYPYKTFVGIKTPKGGKKRGMLLTDEDHKIQFAIVNADGKRVDVEDSLEVKVYKLKWKWWWDNSGEDLSDIVDSYYYDPVLEGKTKSRNGLAAWKLRINYPQWGRYLIRVKNPSSGHCASKIVYIDWPGWAGSPQLESGSAFARMFQFETDKESYQVGEIVKLKIPAPAEGRVLFCLESGSSPMEFEWIDVEKGDNIHEFTVTEDMAPNVYAHLTYIRPREKSDVDLPLRMFSIKPIMVDDAKTHLYPQISMPLELAPEKKATISISEKNGREMTYTVAVVDEGLLDLTRFKTPDPWNFFYAKEALGVKSWDLFENVAGGYDFDLNSLFAVGGDGAVWGKKNAKANRFEPVVKFFGPFHLEAGKRASHSFVMPNYIGSVRTMVVAGYEGAYGNAEQARPVRKNLMLLGTLPRVLGPGEIVDLPVTVFSSKKNLKSAKVWLKTSDAIEIEGASSKSVKLGKGGENTVFFRLKIKERIGFADVNIFASSGSEKAKYDVNIEIRNPNPMLTRVEEGYAAAGESWSAEFKPFGVRGTNSAFLEASALPPVDLSKRLKYLIRYPYGCVEQTVSSAFPQLFVEDFHDISDEGKAEIEKNIKATIARLQLFQTPSGGFSFWPGGKKESDWGTSYAGHFLAEASKKGYDAPQSMLNKWKSYQTEKAEHWENSFKRSSQLLQAYRLYSLALNGAPATGAMNRMIASDVTSPQAMLRIALAYKAAGNAKSAKYALNKTNIDWENISFSEYRYSYGSATRNKALALEAYAALGEDQKAMALLKQISNALSSKKWMSTQTTAYALIAVGKYASAANKELNFQYSIGGGKTKTIKSKKLFSQIEIPLADLKSRNVTVKNLSADGVFARVVYRGSPARGEETAKANGLKLTVDYFDRDGARLNPSNLLQGKSFKAKVTVYNEGVMGDVENIALDQIFPSGWEIVNARLDQSAEEVESPYDYRDVRDDRVYTFFDLKTRQHKTFVVNLIAAYSGEFYMPAVSCSDMYDASVSALVPGGMAVVRRDEKNIN